MTAAPRARLEHRLGRRQLLARVDAQRLLRGAGDRPGDEPVGGGERDGVGQVVLALGVGVADASEQAGEVGRAERHRARVAQTDPALRIGRIALLRTNQRYEGCS